MRFCEEILNNSEIKSNIRTLINESIKVDITNVANYYFQYSKSVNTDELPFLISPFKNMFLFYKEKTITGENYKIGIWGYKHLRDELQKANPKIGRAHV